jgi:hypothetical protein
MGAARGTAPKWVDADLPWDEPAKAEDTPLLAVVDRFHNHEEMSPEAMARAIAELQETVKSLDGRLSGATHDAAAATLAAKGLGVSMVQMGDSLSTRVRGIEESAEIRAEKSAQQVKKLQAANTTTRRIGAALAAVLVIALAAMAVLRPAAAPPKPAGPAQVLYSPDQPAPNP